MTDAATVLDAIATVFDGVIRAAGVALSWLWQERNWLFPGAGVGLFVWIRRQIRRSRVRASRTGALDRTTPVPLAPAALPTQPAPSPLPPNTIRRAYPDANPVRPWRNNDEDKVGIIADSIMESLRAADGSPVSVNPYSDHRGSRLQIEEAVERLRKLRMIEVFHDIGVRVEVTLYLTARGRSALLNN